MTEGAIGDVNFNSCISFSPLHNKRAASEETALS
nr:MAG TPA: Integrin beta-4, Dystonin, PLAKIN, HEMIDESMOSOME, STRUCTURAL PROTEIN [Caudoviricetes sp.]DAZ03665.1 MAG TPA: Integrin beta-4, Dystonin, PLAKIN, HEMIDESMOSOME, STRUCTURAL PROTEIN [Caudoviricetes sp.]